MAEPLAPATQTQAPGKITTPATLGETAAAKLNDLRKSVKDKSVPGFSLDLGADKKGIIQGKAGVKATDAVRALTTSQAFIDFEKALKAMNTKEPFEDPALQAYNVMVLIPGPGGGLCNLEQFMRANDIPANLKAAPEAPQKNAQFTNRFSGQVPPQAVAGAFDIAATAKKA